MIKSENFANVLTSELLLKQDSEVEQEKCKAELYRRLKSIGFTDTQVEQFIAREQTAINEGELYNRYSEQLMAKRKFINPDSPKPDIDKLTISELLLITEEATNLCPLARTRGFNYFEIIYSFAHDKFAEGWSEAIKRLRDLGLADETIKKFFFADLQVVHRIAFNCESTVDAWGNPEKHLN